MIAGAAMLGLLTTFSIELLQKKPACRPMPPSV